jgi:transposase-like protein
MNTKLQEYVCPGCGYRFLELYPRANRFYCSYCKKDWYIKDG